MNVALIGLGNARWIAGVQYHHSILLGNSLLPPAERLSLRVYLEEDVHRTTDYDAVRSLARGVHSTDFFPERPRPILRKLRKMARIVVRQHRVPAFPSAALPRLLERHGADLVFTASGVEAAVDLPQACWIPDFQHWDHPEFFPPEERARRDTVYAEVVERAARTVVSNERGRLQLLERYPEAADRVVPLPFTMSLGEDWRAGDPAAALRRHGLPEKFLLFPGQFWKHKNHAVLFEAIRAARAAGLDDVVLVCTGYPHDPRDPDHAPSLHAFVEQHGLRSVIRILGLLPREEQVQIMRAAAAIVQPSLYEGWSALLEDCRSLGKTVLVSDIPMHRDHRFAGMHPFDPHAPEALAALIRSLWPDLRPGPDLAREPAAEADYRARLADFARRFAAICRDAATAGRAPRPVAATSA